MKSIKILLIPFLALLFEVHCAIDPIQELSIPRMKEFLDHKQKTEQPFSDCFFSSSNTDDRIIETIFLWLPFFWELAKMLYKYQCAWQKLMEKNKKELPPQEPEKSEQRKPA